MSKPQSSTFLKSRHHKIRLKPNNTHLTVTLNLFIKNLSKMSLCFMTFVTDITLHTLACEFRSLWSLFQTGSQFIWPMSVRINFFMLVKLWPFKLLFVLCF